MARDVLGWREYQPGIRRCYTHMEKYERQWDRDMCAFYIFKHDGTGVLSSGNFVGWAATAAECRMVVLLDLGYTIEEILAEEEEYEIV